MHARRAVLKVFVFKWPSAPTYSFLSLPPIPTKCIGTPPSPNEPQFQLRLFFRLVISSFRVPMERNYAQANMLVFSRRREAAAAADAAAAEVGRSLACEKPGETAQLDGETPSSSTGAQTRCRLAVY